jgi:hypothetical protein
MKFSKPLKIYLFKKENRVKLSIMVTDSCVNTYNLDVKHIEFLLKNWKSDIGAEFNYGKSDWHVVWKKCGPRPENAPASFVAINIHYPGQAFNYRVSYDDMVALEKDYFYQKNNKMHWD